MAAKNTFNLFESEERALANALDLAKELAARDPELGKRTQELAKAYDRSMREQRRLLRLSDRLQDQMATLNQELERRRTQAEQTLIQLRETQETLVQAEKLASLGALVGGIAHEINTPVGITLSCASHLADITEKLTKLYQADDLGVEDLERYIETAQESAQLIILNCERAARLIGSFKQVAVDRTVSDLRRFDLWGLIHETLDSLRPALRPSHTQVQVECAVLPEIEGHPGLMSQVLTNLVINAISHGFENRLDGQILIHIQDDGQNSFKMRFEDNGCGIDPAHLSHIFDPFFTTKRGKGGSGLGLNVVYNLITGPMQGSITVDSQLGKGTTFHMTFPKILSELEQM